MAILLPRLRVGNGTIERLKCEADRHGITTASLISEILEREFTIHNTGQETLFRIIFVAEKFGLVVGGSRLFPASWVDVGKLSETACRELASSYLVWRRNHDENSQRTSR